MNEHFIVIDDGALVMEGTKEDCEEFISDNQSVLGEVRLMRVEEE